MIFTYTKKENDTYKTVKQVLTQEFNISYRLLLKLKKADKIFLNGSSPLYMDFPININDTVSAILDFEEDNSNIIPKKMNLNILFEDEFFLILNKPVFISYFSLIIKFSCNSCKSIIALFIASSFVFPI